jgi:hypothetical protein
MYLLFLSCILEIIMVSFPSFFFPVKQEHQYAKEFTPLMVFLGVLVLFYLLINNISKNKLNKYLI